MHFVKVYAGYKMLLLELKIWNRIVRRSGNRNLLEIHAVESCECTHFSNSKQCSEYWVIMENDTCKFRSFSRRTSLWLSPCINSLSIPWLVFFHSLNFNKISSQYVRTLPYSLEMTLLLRNCPHLKNDWRVWSDVVTRGLPHHRWIS